MGVDIFILLLDVLGYHWTDYARCKFPDPQYYTCEMEPAVYELLTKALEIQ